jgi:hypothetical protein
MELNFLSFESKILKIKILSFECHLLFNQSLLKLYENFNALNLMIFDEAE